MKKTIKLVGDKGAGKSALIQTAAHIPFNKQSQHSIIGNITIEVTPSDNNKPISLLLSNEVLYPEHADATILVFDLSNQFALTNLQAWQKQVLKNDPGTKIYVVGCKSDLPKEETLIAGWAEYLQYPYWEVSAKEGTRIDELFQYVAHRLTQERYTNRDAVLKAAQQKNAGQDEFNKEYRVILEKLDPKQPQNKDHAYQNLGDISKDIKRINAMTCQMESASYHSQRAEIRKALEHALERMEASLCDKWHNKLEALTTELSALQNIKKNLLIIQPKASQDNRPKFAMIKVDELVEKIDKLKNFVIEKNKLEAMDTPNPKEAMLFLAKLDIKNKDNLKKLLEKHLIKEITPETRQELAETMKSLDWKSKEKLKKNLIRATKKEILDNTENYKSLFDDKDDKASLIPLIAILCISGSGKINQKTASYTEWLTRMNKSKPSITKSAMTTFKEGGVEGVFDQLRGKIKAKKLKPGSNITDSDL
ncbi:MAG TPA: hypothetical protein VFU82_04550 [Gammaproteobacteria bacterium]|nr:hypothetical protein [Gammaproteobacteria bacterium]